MSDLNNIKHESEAACDSKLSRKQFLADVLKKAALAGTIVAAPKVLDKFLMPPVYAKSSTSVFHDGTGGTKDATHGSGGLNVPDSQQNGGYN